MYSVFDVAGISRLRARPEGFPLALWTASAPSGSYLAIMSVVFIWYTNSTQAKKLPIKTNKQECAPEGFQRAIGKPFGRLRRGETPAPNAILRHRITQFAHHPRGGNPPQAAPRG